MVADGGDWVLGRGLHGDRWRASTTRGRLWEVLSVVRAQVRTVTEPPQRSGRRCDAKRGSLEMMLDPKVGRRFPTKRRREPQQRQAEGN